MKPIFLKRASIDAQRKSTSRFVRLSPQSAARSTARDPVAYAAALEILG